MLVPNSSEDGALKVLAALVVTWMDQPRSNPHTTSLVRRSRSLNFESRLLSISGTVFAWRSPTTVTSAGKGAGEIVFTVHDASSDATRPYTNLARGNQKWHGCASVPRKYFHGRERATHVQPAK